MRVKNKGGTSGRNCKCGSWINHYKNFSTGSTLYCSVKNCYERATVGAHIVLADSLDKSEYIVPFCDSHNQQFDGVFEIGDTDLAPANRSETCEKG